MKFQKNNKIKYTQDFRGGVGLPDIEFIVKDITRDEKVMLVAPGYGETTAIGRTANYGNGVIFVSMEEFSVRDRILIEREFNASNKSCCSCSCGSKCS